MGKANFVQYGTFNSHIPTLHKQQKLSLLRLTSTIMQIQYSDAVKPDYMQALFPVNPSCVWGQFQSGMILAPSLPITTKWRGNYKV